MPPNAIDVTIDTIALFIVIPPIVERLSTFDEALSRDARSRSRS
jgi:hypothetical protein